MSVYKLSSTHCDKVYIGSTTKPLKLRFQHHKASYKKNKDVSNSTSYKLLQYDDCVISLIVEVNSLNTLKLIERYYIENSNCVNHNLPSRDIKEYRQTNRQHLNDYANNYYQNNKLAVLNKLQQKRNINREIKDLMRINVN